MRTKWGHHHASLGPTATAFITPGTIDAVEFRALLARMGVPVTNDVFERLVARYDTDGDGLIAYGEFFRGLPICRGRRQRPWSHGGHGKQDDLAQDLGPEQIANHMKVRALSIIGRADSSSGSSKQRAAAVAAVAAMGRLPISPLATRESPLSRSPRPMPVAFVRVAPSSYENHRPMRRDHSV